MSFFLGDVSFCMNVYEAVCKIKAYKRGMHPKGQQRHEDLVENLHFLYLLFSLPARGNKDLVDSNSPVQLKWNSAILCNFCTILQHTLGF